MAKEGEYGDVLQIHDENGCGFEDLGMKPVYHTRDLRAWFVTVRERLL